jgi:hypothetical protein
MLPRAHKASPTEEAAIELATTAGREKEGAQYLSVVSPGKQEMTLHWSCSQWRGNIIFCGQQYHSLLKTTRSSKASNHL